MTGNEDGFAWLMRYAAGRHAGARTEALDRYNRTLIILAEWEARPDSGYYRLWHDIVSGDNHG